MIQIKRKLMRGFFGIDPNYSDMFLSSNERFYASLYLEKISRHFKSVFGSKKLRILDAGCQAGRLAIPLAREGHHVTGVDTSAFALRRAKSHAQKEEVSVSWVKGDVQNFLRRNTHPFDVILCIEVLYLRENYRAFLSLFNEHLSSGGLLIVSHRTKFYYISQALKKEDFETALSVVTQQEGHLWGSYFNWQTAKETKALYEALGFRETALYPIGTFSENIIQLESLSEENRSKLLRIESEFKEERSGCARYLLACAQKP